MSNNLLPVVLLLGAKSTEAPLDSIPEELSRLKALFKDYEQNLPDFELDYEPFFTPEQLKTKLSQQADRVAILHFAGHSDAKGLLTDDGAVYSNHIANIINTWSQPPALIFLNGCDNAQQVKLFHQAGVALVIATQSRVDDRQAAEFARAFYSQLFSGRGRIPVQTAFDRASSQTQLTESGEARSIDLEEFEADEGAVWDWSLFPLQPEDLTRNIHSLLHPYSPDNPDGQIFLSYSRNDQETASQLRETLVNEGFTVFRDQESIRVGDNWMQRLQHAVQRCSAFVLLVGRDGVEQQRWVGAELEAALSRKLSPHDDAKRLPIFPILLPEATPDELPVFLQQIQSVFWHPDQSPLPTGLVEQLHGRIDLEDVPAVLSGEPYRGLSYFREQDADRFFGRHEEVLEALQKLGEDKQPESDTPQPRSFYYRWLQVHASSGAGKSSLVRAGLLPKIRQGALWRRTGYADWLILDVMMPGEKPLEMLAQVLARAFPDKGMMGAWLKEFHDPQNPDHSEGLSFALRSLAQPGQAILLVVDQFEELFTQADTEQCRQFDRLLATALTDRNCPFFLITTIRSDFLDRFEYLPELLRIYNSHKSDYLLPTITETGLRELITLPARLSGMQVGDDLTQAIVQDARSEPGALPLTESALSELWNEARSKGEHRLSKPYYDDSQGVVGMLARQADKLIDSLGDKRRAAALNLLLALTQINEGGRHTRRRLAMDDAVHEAGGGQQGEAIMRALAGKHDDPNRQTESGQTLPLIVTGLDGNDGYVELVHEMLVRGSGQKDEVGNLIGYWPTLYQYIHKHRDRDSQRQQLKINADRWNEKQGIQRFQGLATSKELKLFSKLRPLQKSPEGQYLRQSHRVYRIYKGLLATLLVFTGLWGWWMTSVAWSERYDFPQDYAWKKMLWAVGLSRPSPPKMVAIEAGAFEMGCKPGRDLIEGMTGCPDSELPSRKVTVPAFSMSQYEITFEEYDYYLWHQDMPNDAQAPTDRNWGRNNRPVVNVAWDEARAYAKWQGEQTEQNCRLPTEAEWEYAARAGSDTAYPWGDTVSKNKANCRGCSSKWDGAHTLPVGQFSANAFGLYDMHGNVLEWVHDCYAQTFQELHTANYDGIPVDGSAREIVECDFRVSRGGSWLNTEESLRSASRNDGLTIGSQDSYIGFRVLCSTPPNH